jgi:hypothetical protein
MIYSTKLRLSISLIFIALSFFLQSCANIVSLEGGDKDITPPKLDSLRSTRNFQTQFTKKPIELTFNEWVKLDNPNQIVVSPPLEKTLKVQLKGKTVVLKFDDAEVLRPNATYTINFGESIKDISEGNKAAMRFVFSTGNEIDSLKSTFKVLDAVSNEPVENVLVLLYENTKDSVVSKERPFYFAKTDKAGVCTIENLKKGNFKVFALADGNTNYKYDLPTEKIGFTNDLIKIEKQDSAKVTTISLFEPQLPIRIKEKYSNAYGVVKIVFSQNALSAKPQWDNVGQATKVETQGDTLRVWYHQEQIKDWNLYVLKDTIAIKTANKEAFLKKEKLALTASSSVRKGGKFGTTVKAEIPSTTIAFSKQMSLLLNHPVVKFDTSKIKIIDDTTKSRNFKLALKIDSSSSRNILISSANWQENHAYTITALPGAFTDFYGLSNDTIINQLKITPKKNFGDITLNYAGLKPDSQYIVQLLNSTGVLLEEKIINQKSKGTILWTTLEPIVYKLNIITDVNKNKRWDSGNYYEKRQPEPIFSKQLEELKPNWTLETEVDFEQK